MGEKEVLNTNLKHCKYASDRRDCDGDWDTYCFNDDNCQYQHNVRDCDGDVVSLCRK